MNDTLEDILFRLDLLEAKVFPPKKSLPPRMARGKYGTAPKLQYTLDLDKHLNKLTPDEQFSFLARFSDEGVDLLLERWLEEYDNEALPARYADFDLDLSKDWLACLTVTLWITAEAGAVVNGTHQFVYLGRRFCYREGGELNCFQMQLLS